MTLQLLPPGFDAKKFSGETPYAVMFGPDVCGTSTRKTHVIFTDDAGKNHLIKKSVKVETDNLSHRYTLVLKNDNSFEVFIDGKSVEKGTLEADFDIIPSKTIKDPAASKPADWVDNAQIDDPTDVKPAGYDDIPARIPDAAAKKPEDWDDEEDGEWEAPTVANPDYKVRQTLRNVLPHCTFDAYAAPLPPPCRAPGLPRRSPTPSTRARGSTPRSPTLRTVPRRPLSRTTCASPAAPLASSCGR